MFAPNTKYQGLSVEVGRTGHVLLLILIVFLNGRDFTSVFLLSEMVGTVRAALSLEHSSVFASALGDGAVHPHTFIKNLLHAQYWGEH